MGKAADDEHRVVERLVAGDRAAFDGLYRKHNAAMVRMCARLVRNHPPPKSSCRKPGSRF